MVTKKNTFQRKESVTIQDLSHAQARLVRLMQQMNFGTIHGLHVRDGQPVFDPAPEVEREVKLGSGEGPRPELEGPNFTLKREVVEMFERMESMADGVIPTIKVKHGLPFMMTIRERVN